MIENYWLNALYSVIPTIMVGLVFWLVMRSVLRGDRTERKVYAEIEAEERAKLGVAGAPMTPGAAKRTGAPTAPKGPSASATL